MPRVGLPAEQLTDEALLAGLSTGSREVALAFVRRFQAHVFAVALAIVGERALAEDVAQQTFERVWRKSSTFDPDKAGVRAWLTAVTRNIAIDNIKKRRPEPLDPADLVPLLAPSPEQPEEQSLLREAHDQLRRAIRALPPEQGRALVMAGVYRMTAQEVADAEGIPLGTAKTRIRTGMHKLRDLLAGPPHQSPSEVKR